MIERTKPMRRRDDAQKNLNSSSTNADAPAAAAPLPQSFDDMRAEKSLDRRDWFRSLVPALGNGLVEILRTSNNLRRDIEEARQGIAPRASAEARDRK
jgi:hypothetical protein